MTKDHWQTACIHCPRPPEEHTANPIKSPKIVENSQRPLFLNFTAQLLAWPDLSSYTDALRPVEDLQSLNGNGWSMVNGQTRGEGRGAV